MVAAKTTNVSHIGADTSSEWRSKGRLPLRLSELQVERHLSRGGLEQTCPFSGEYPGVAGLLDFGMHSSI